MEIGHAYCVIRAIFIACNFPVAKSKLLSTQHTTYAVHTGHSIDQHPEESPVRRCNPFLRCLDVTKTGKNAGGRKRLVLIGGGRRKLPKAIILHRKFSRKTCGTMPTRSSRKKTRILFITSRKSFPMT